jgi:hypothetical protein
LLSVANDLEVLFANLVDLDSCLIGVHAFVHLIKRNRLELPDGEVIEAETLVGLTHGEIFAAVPELFNCLTLDDPNHIHCDYHDVSICEHKLNAVGVHLCALNMEVKEPVRKVIELAIKGLLSRVCMAFDEVQL